MTVARLKTSQGWIDLAGPQGDSGPPGSKGDTGYDTAPIGTVLSWTGKGMPEGYVLADGASTHTQTQYPQGYAFAVAEKAAGNSLWDADTTAKTFKVPDLRDRFIFGAGTKPFGTLSLTTGAQATLGEETHTLTTAEIPGHTHTGAGSGTTDLVTVGNLNHNHSLAPDGMGFLTTAPSSGTTATRRTGTTTDHTYRAGSEKTANSGSLDHTHPFSYSFTTAPTGDDGAHNNMPPYAVLTYIVKIAGVTASASVIVGPPGPIGADSTVPGPIGTTGYDTAPIGAVISTTRSTWGDEYVLANGQSLTEVAYPDALAVAVAEVAASNPLWTVSGTAPNRTFTVPDLRDRFLFGAGAKTRGTKSQSADPAAANYGKDTHTLLSGEMPVHSHAPPASATAFITAASTAGSILQTAASGLITRSGVPQDAGGGLPHNNMPPYAVLVFLVKVKGVSASASVIQGPTGLTGPTGPGVPVGGTTGQVLAKKTATDLDTEWIVPPAGGGGGGGGHTIQDEGTSLAQRTKLNFMGAGVTVTDDAANDRTLVDVPAITASAAQSALAGYATTVTANSAWTLQAIPSALTITKSDGTNDDFTRNADGSLTVNTAGNYVITGSLEFASAVPDNTNVNWLLCAKAGATPTIGENQVGKWNDTMGSSANTYPSLPIVSTVTLPAGYRIAVWLYQTAGGSRDVLFRSFSIARVGGPKGDKGDTGGNATVPMDTWHLVGAAGEPAFVSGWVHYDTASPTPVGGSTWQWVGFRKDPLGRVHLKGLLSANTSKGVGNPIFTLPVGYRPPKTALIDTSTMGISGCRIDVSGATGEVVLGSAEVAVVNGTFISLEGLSFDTESVMQMPTGPKGDKGDPGNLPETVPMENWIVVGPQGGAEPALRNSWVNYAGVDSVAAFRKDPLGRVALRGAIKGGANGSVVFVLPVGYRPPKNIAMPVTTGSAGSTGYVTILWTGEVSLAGGVTPTTGSWLDGVEFDTETVTAMPTGPAGPKGDTGGNATVPMEGWHTVGAAGEPAYAAGWTGGTLRYRKDPLGKVILDGYSGSGTANTPIFYLPVGYRPSIGGYRVALPGGGGAGQLMIDSSTGAVQPGTTTAWLDGTIFDTGTVTQMPTGPQGPKGDTGDPSTSGPFVHCSAGTVTAVAAGNATLPIGSIVQISNAADFTRNANGSVTINKAGNYVIAAGCNCNTQLPANTRTQFELRANGGVFMYQSGHDPWAQASLTAIRQCASGDVITVVVWNDLAVQEIVNSFSIAATTGPKGDDTGVYVGTAEPTGAQTIWLDTDETSFMQAVPFVSVLPASPLDGQEVYFQTAAMAVDGIVWHLRYRAASASAYKWEFIGGPALQTRADSFAAPTANSVWTTPATWPRITLPLAGDYDTEFGIAMGASQISRDIRASAFLGGVCPAYLYMILPAVSGWSGTWWSTTAGTYRFTGAAAAAAISLGYYTSDYTNTSYQMGWIRTRPVRVG